MYGKDIIDAKFIQAAKKLIAQVMKGEREIKLDVKCSSERSMALNVGF